VERGYSKGFWIDKKYLKNSSFNDALETALHELCHKFGADESSEFSYALTKVNAKVIQELIKNGKTRSNLQALRALWNEINAS